MSDVQIGLSGLAILVGLIATRVPIGIALINVSFGGFWHLMGLPGNHSLLVCQHRAAGRLCNGAAGLGHRPAIHGGLSHQFH